MDIWIVCWWLSLASADINLIVTGELSVELSCVLPSCHMNRGGLQILLKCTCISCAENSEIDEYFQSKFMGYNLFLRRVRFFFIIHIN